MLHPCGVAADQVVFHRGVQGEGLPPLLGVRPDDLQHRVVLIRGQVDVEDAQVHAADGLQRRLAHVQPLAVLGKGLLHGVDVADGAHHPGQPAIVEDGLAADPVPAEFPLFAPRGDDPHLKNLRPAVADVVPD